MSKNNIITWFLLLCVVSTPLAAQGFPTIERNPIIKAGTLPNEVMYYLAPNSSSKGYANFALVQKGNLSTDQSRSLLNTLPHFKKKSPYAFLASKGVGYSRGGYISSRDGSTVFSFNNVPTFDSAATDSTILLIFDLIQAYKGEQAIVVSGDFELSNLEGKLFIFALTVTPRVASAPPLDYTWAPSDKVRFLHTENNTNNLATLSCIWSAPRTPAHLLNSAQPIVSSIYARQLEYIVKKRIEKCFFSQNIPLGGIRSRYTSSAGSAGDEKHSFSVSFGIENLQKATALLASIFSELDSVGVSMGEYTDAKMATLYASQNALSATTNYNTALSEQCISAFLYGTNPASPKAINNFFKGRKIAPETELSLFNQYVFALLDPKRSLELRCDTPAGPISKDFVLATFDSAWKNATRAADATIDLQAAPATASTAPAQAISCQQTSCAVAPAQYGSAAPSQSATLASAQQATAECTPAQYAHADTLSLLSPSSHKVKVKSTAKDPITGGNIWTFSNGVRVIFKQTGNDGILNYGLLLKGGYSYVPAIGPGESSFVGDVMGLYSVAGMTPMRFHNMLEANGIVMKGQASLTDVQVKGSAPAGKLELLLKALLSYSHDRQTDSTAFAYYKACEKLRTERTRLSRDGIIAAIDSTMCPDYFYPATKNLDKLCDDLPQRVDAYLTDEFAKFSDGLLVLIGDAPEEQVKRILARYLGSFTISSAFSVRPKVEYNLRPGWSTYMVEASQSRVGSGEVCVNVGMATRRPFTIRSYNAFLIASMAMENAIIESIAPLGMHAQFTLSAQVFPAEKLTFYVTCRPCPDDGLPAGISPAEPMEVLRALRRGISKASRGSLSQKDLDMLKTAVRNSTATRLSQAQFLMSAVMMRNSEGKDIISNYNSAIDSVTLADVNAVLHELDFGSKVEYIIR